MKIDKETREMLKTIELEESQKLFISRFIVQKFSTKIGFLSCLLVMCKIFFILLKDRKISKTLQCELIYKKPMSLKSIQKNKRGHKK